ncbi:MAG TPA: hypothetical protein VNO35_18175 [Steroidobacteraceae bacterium]|nr:hypothetical protein [Steroidobacteraceae bacterium]
MKTSLEQAWLQISTDLDEVLDLDAQARQAWLVSLETRDPDRAERVRPYMLDLKKLESDHFLARALPSVLAVNTSLAGRRLGSYTVESERYSTAAAFAGDLERHLRSEPILARSQSAWYRAGKFLVRNKLPVLAASAFLVAMIAALGMALWQTHVAREQAVEAQELQQ